MSKGQPEASSSAKAVREVRSEAAWAGRLRSGGNTAEDMLNDFEWKLAGLLQIAEATQELYCHVDHQQRWKLGMTEKTANHVFSLWYSFDEMRERIMQMENRAWQEEADDAS